MSVLCFSWLVNDFDICAGGNAWSIPDRGARCSGMPPSSEADDGRAGTVMKLERVTEIYGAGSGSRRFALAGIGSIAPFDRWPRLVKKSIAMVAFTKPEV